MPLACHCDFDDCDWYYEAPIDYSTLDTKRRKRCKSCRDLIDIGATVLKFPNYRFPNSDVEERIYGEDGEVYRADMYHCERCGDLWFSLQELGFDCISPDENMIALAKDYGETYGPNQHDKRKVSADA